MNVKISEAVAEYRKQGVSFFPIPFKSKKSVIKWETYQERPPTDEEVKGWFNGHPSNLAVVCGKVSGNLVVLDCDSEDKFFELGAIILNKTGLNVLDFTKVSKTSRGFHVWLRTKEAIKSQKFPNLDIKAEGGYIIVPPSTHPDGPVYQFVNQVGIRTIGSLDEIGIDVSAKPPTQAPTGNQPSWVSQLLATSIAEHEGRNDAAIKLAGYFRNLVPQDVTERILRDWNSRNRPPLPESELQATLTSVGRYAPKPPTSNPSEPPDGDFHLTDTGNAEYFCSLHKHDLRYDHRLGAWFEWNTHHWRQDSDGQIKRLAVKAIRERYKTAVSLEDLKQREIVAKWAIASETRARLESMLAIAQNLIPMATSGDGWDRDPWLFAVANGVVDLRTGQLHDGQPEDMIRMHSPVVFDPQAQAPRWLSFLDEIFCGDSELIDWLQRFMGYSLSGDTREQSLVIDYGSGANGKGRFSAVHRYIMGDYAHDAPFSTFELSQRAAIPNDLAALVGKRLVTSSETNEGTRLNEARVKSLTGQDPVTARFLHCEFFTFQPVAKLWLAVNHRPRVGDDSFGFWRRVRLVPFNRQFTGEQDDKLLLDKLIAEAPGILNWMLAGCLVWQKRGLGESPQSVQQATTEYQTDSDPLSQFILEQCVINPQATVQASKLYKSYLAWADEQGLREKERLTNTAFGRRMTGKNFKKSHNRDGTFYQGLASKCDGFVTGFEANAKNSQLNSTLNPRVGNLQENPSNPSPTRHNDQTGVLTETLESFAKSGMAEKSSDNDLPKLTSDGHTPNCPVCGANEWVMAPDGRLECPCGNKILDGGR